MTSIQGVTDTFDRSYPAAPVSVGRVRTDIAGFAAALGVRSARIDDIRLAVSEAVTNAVMHAYRETTGTIQVTARHAGSSLWISVRDFGCGMQPRPIGAEHTGMGLGLALIGRVVSGFSVAPQVGAGTDVRMRFDLVSAATRAERRVPVA